MRSGCRGFESLTLTTCFFCPDYDVYHIDFSRRAGDFHFKVVVSSKILVAMATKMVATWRVGSPADWQRDGPYRIFQGAWLVAGNYRIYGAC